MLKGISFSIGSIAIVLLIVVGLLAESLVPGAILHFAAGWDFFTSVLIAAGVQAAAGLLVVLAVAGIGLGASR